MNKISASLCLLFISFFATSYSQEKIELIDSHDLVNDGMDLHDRGRYESAIEKYDKIDRNDSLYITALAEKGLSLIQLEEYDEAVNVLQLAINSTETPLPELYINLGTALDERGDSIASLMAYDEGIKRFPMHHILYYKRGVTLDKLQRYDEAVESLKHSLDLNPAYADVHLYLGNMAARDGKVVLAMLSLNAFLLLEPTTERSEEAVSTLEEITADEPDPKKSKGIVFNKSGDDYKDIESLIFDRIALSKKYKVKVSLDFDFIKQNHLLFEKLQYDENDPGFWMHYYVPFFKKVYDEGQFENFSYYELLSIDNNTVQSTLSKKIKGIKSFDAWWPGEWFDLHREHDYVLNGKKQKVNYWYSNAGMLEIIGTSEGHGKSAVLIGPYEAFSDNGCINAKGQLDAEGKKTGEFFFYDEFGRLTEKVNYKDDEYDGVFTSYFSNGVVAAEITYKDGDRDGITKVYFYYGGINEMKQFKEDKLDGSYVSYYPNGKVEYEATYKEDDLDGVVTHYFPDGIKESEMTYKEGKADGLNTEYFRNGQVSLTQNFVEGDLDGPFKTYHLNGAVASEGTAKKGDDVGEYKSYYPDGQLLEFTTYDETGKLNGTKKVYDRDGLLYYEWDYSKGEISGYRYYDKSGKIISEAKRKLSKFPFVGYYPDGTKRFEGDYEGSEQNGTWKYYDDYGNLQSDEPYDKGTTKGILKTYYANGDLESQVKYSDDERDGYYEKYYANGNMEEQGWYREGDLVGNWKTYYPNGNIKSHVYYVDNSQQGWQEYYDEKGRLETSYLMEYDMMKKSVDYDTSGNPVDTVELNEPTFKLTDHHYNGELSFEGEYKNGYADGPFTWYAGGGQLAVQGGYLNDERDGEWKWYTEQGKIDNQGAYDYGVQNGEWTEFHDNGKPMSKRQFYFDNLEGKFVRYYKNGQVEVEGNYIDDERNGEFRYYDQLGQLEIVKYFVGGKVVGYSYNGTDGKLVTMIPIVNGSGTITAYFQNGKKSIEYTMVKGNYEGKFTEWFSNGKLYEESYYKEDDWDGNRKVYYSNGKLELEENYKDGFLEGMTTEYYEDGKLKETANYFSGDQYGETVIYNTSGKPIKTILYYNGKIVYEK